MHRVTKVIDPNGNGTSYTYDASGNLSTMLEANGAKTSYVYDLLDQVTSQIDPEGKVTQLQYDLAGNITSVTEQGGRTTKLTYDKNYNLVSVTDPMGYVTSQEFDKNNRTISVTNALGNTVSYEYDALGQMTKVTDASGAVVQYAYDAHGNITKITNPLGDETVYSYDLADHLIQVTDPMQRKTNYTYDSMGNLISQTDADGKVTAYTYDLEGNMTSLTDENGSTERMTYDVAGNLKSIVRPDSTTVIYDYDKLNKLVSKTYSEDDSSVLYLYDTVGNRISMTDTTGETAYTYDIMGRVTSVTSADGKKVQYAYDDCGRLGAITYADGRTVSYAYDLNDRLVSVTDGDKVTEYAYDALGRVTETARPNGTKTTYTYDVRGNLTELVNKNRDGSVISSFAYTYNEQGYITKEVARDADSTVFREYTYNLSGELVKFIEKEGWKIASYTYSYNDSGNRIKLQKAGIDRPETVTYQYNAANQLISQTSTIDGTTHYEYNENGSLILEQTAGKEDITYEYTVEQRLAAVRQGGALLMAASYDGDGNRVFQISRGSSEQYAQKADPDQSVDTPISPDTDTVTNVGSIPNGNQSAENPTITDDDLAPIPGASGTAQAEVYTYYEKVYADPADTIFWYGFGQGMLQFFGNFNTALSAYLSDWFCHAWDYITGQYELVMHSVAAEPYSSGDVEALREAGISDEEIAQITGGTLDADGKVTVTYVPSQTVTDNQTEDASGQTAQQPADSETIVIPENPSQTQRVDYELTYYVNNVNTENTQVLMEYGRRDELKNVYTYGNERISVDTIADTFNAVTDDIQTDYYLYDGRGSVANVVTASAEIIATYTYDPFGNVTSGAPEFDSFYGYNAEDTNPVTGLQYLRAQYYDTESGRFNVADTYLGDVSQPLTLNRYSYTTNNPVMQTDPSGHWPKWLDKAVEKVKDGAEKVVESVKSTAKKVGEFVEKNADVIGAVAGVVAGVAVGIAVAVTAPVSVPALAIAAGVAAGVGVAAIGVGVGGSVKTNYEVKQYNKKADKLLQEYDTIAAECEEFEANISSYTPEEAQEKVTYLQQRMQVIEERRQQLCETGERLEKQADIYSNVTYAGLGLLAVGMAPIAGPALVNSMAGNTLLSGMTLMGNLTVGGATSLGMAGMGTAGLAYAGSDIVEAVTDFNPIKDTIYGGDEELFEEHQQILNTINTTTAVVGTVATIDRFNQLQMQATQKSVKLSGEWKDVNESMSEASRGYQTQITGHEGQAWVQNGVKYDGMKDGVLIEAKGKYAQFVDKKTGEFFSWYNGADSLVSQARRQIAASEGARIQWYFSEMEALEATQTLFTNAGITGIEFIFQAAK